MATRALVTSAVSPPSIQCVLGSWSGMLNGDDGGPVGYAIFPDRSIQVTGTLGAGGTFVIEGSNDGVNYVTLHDPQGVALSKTALGIYQIEELTQFMRPRVTAGDGTTSLVFTMIIKGLVL